MLTDVDEAAGSTQAESLARTGLHVEFRRMDVTIEADVDRVLEGIAMDSGSLDLLVNNAGITTHARIEDLRLSDWRRVLDVDLDGVFLCLRAAGRIMLRQGVRQHRQHRFDRLGSRRARAGGIHGVEGRRRGPDQGRRRRMVIARHPGECGRSGLHRYADASRRV